MIDIFRQTPNKIQPKEAEGTSWCGPAVVTMVLKSSGEQVDQQQLAQEMGTNQEEGTSVENLRKAFWIRGYSTVERAYSNWEELLQLRNHTQFPILVEWMDSRDYSTLGIETPNRDPDSHYSLVVGMDDTHILLADPSIGKDYLMERNEWMRSWKDRTDDVWDYAWFMLVGK